MLQLEREKVWTNANQSRLAVLATLLGVRHCIALRFALAPDGAAKDCKASPLVRRTMWRSLLVVPRRRLQVIRKPWIYSSNGAPFSTACPSGIAIGERLCAMQVQMWLKWWYGCLVSSSSQRSS
jgi:hypothetical protein